MLSFLSALYDHANEAAVALQGDRLYYANAAARGLFGPELSDLPSGLAEHPAEHFSRVLALPSGDYTVLGDRGSGVLLLRFSPCAHSLFTPGLRGAFGSSLANVGLAIELMRTHRGPSAYAPGEVIPLRTGDPQDVSVLHHSYFSLRRLYQNYATAMDLDRGALTLQGQSVDLLDLCGELLSTVGALLERPVRLTLHCPHLTQLYCFADPILMERVVLNLLVNAIQHSPDDGCVTLALDASPKRAILIVTDGGCGFAPEWLEPAAARYPASTLPSDPARAGLGLFLVRGIVALHGGTVSLTNIPQGGAQVRVELPTDQTVIALREKPLHDGGDMDRILTELSGTISSRRYVDRFLD